MPDSQSADIAIGWVDLTAASDLEWRGVFDSAVQRLSGQFRFLPATQTTPEVQLMIVAFDLKSLDQVVDSRRLEKRLASLPVATDEFYLIGYGRTRPMPQLHQIEELLDDQAPQTGMRRAAHIFRTRDEFEPVCTSVLSALGARYQVPTSGPGRIRGASSNRDRIEGA